MITVGGKGEAVEASETVSAGTEASEAGKFSRSLQGRQA